MPTRPDTAMEKIINSSKYVSKVKYLEGDSKLKYNLKRCIVEKAKAVVILSNKLTNDANKEDAKTILQAMVIKGYLKSFQKSN